LANVRVIYESRATLFWLEVDSTNTGNGSSSPVSTVLPTAVGLTPAVCWCSSGSRAVAAESALGQQEGAWQGQRHERHQQHSLVEKEKLWQNSRALAAASAGTYSLQVPGLCCATSGQQQDQERLIHRGVQLHARESPSSLSAAPLPPDHEAAMSSVPGASGSLLGGLARIQQRLKSIHPATLAHHLASKQQKSLSPQNALHLGGQE